MSHQVSSFYPSQPEHPQAVAPAVRRLFAAPLLRRTPDLPAAQAEAPNLSLLGEMRQICAANGEQRRLRLILACEQLCANLTSLALSPARRNRLEARLIAELIQELGDCIEAP